MFISKFGSIAALLALASVPALALPVVTVGAPSVVFTYTTGQAIPAAQNVAVTSDTPTTIGGTTTNYIVGGNPGWLSVFPPGPQNTPATLSFSVTPNALPAGSYIAQVSVTTTGPVDPSSSLVITVFLTVGGGASGPPVQTVTATPSAFTFTWVSGDPLPAAQAVAIKVSDDATFNITRTTDSLTQWLSVSPTSGTSPGTISITANPTGLPSGTYNGTVTVTAPFSVVQIPVQLIVSGLGLSVNPTALTMNVPQNYGLSAPQFVRVTSTGGLPFQTSTVSDGNWLQVDIPSGTTPATVQVRANTSGLQQGTYTGTLTVRSGSLTSTDIAVNLTVGPPATVGLQPASLSFTYTIGDPIPATLTSRVNSLSANPQNFTFFTTTSYEGTNWLAASTNQNVTPAVVSVQVLPANLAAGSYTGLVVIQPSAANASPQPIQITLTVKAPPPPFIQSVTNSASYASASVAPGEFVTLFGTTIGPKDLIVAPTGALPRTLGNTIVSFDGLPAPILYASATQTGVQVPYGLTAGQNTNIVVTYNAVNSAVKSMTVTPTYPGLFTSDSSGKGQAAALNTDFSLNGPSNPAARGSVLVLYGTGEGKTTPFITEGSIVPVIQPIPATQLPVTVTVGGQLAQVLYAGETPGVIAGLMQVNVRVPDTTTTGSNVPVLIFVNGVPSQPNVTVAIK